MSANRPESSDALSNTPHCHSSIRVWQCVTCGEMTGGGIKSQKKNSGIAGYCRFCGPHVAARLRWWNSTTGFHDNLPALAHADDRNNPRNMIKENNIQKLDSKPVEQKQSCSTSSLASKIAMFSDNVKRFYDLCLLIHESREEMKLLDQQYEDITNDAIAEYPEEWFSEAREVTVQREWEAANPGWRCAGGSIRKCKKTSQIN